MQTLEITRNGDLAVSDQLDEMRRWLEREDIRTTDLHAVRNLRARVTYSATFEKKVDADRFLEAFREFD